jgi:membrane-bound lytic murein transglycosylase D
MDEARIMTGYWGKKLIVRLFNSRKFSAAISGCCLLFTSLAFALPNLEGIQIYHKDVHLIPELKQGLQDDIDRYRNADDIWNTLRQEFVLDHFENDPAVQAQIEFFLQHQDFLLNSANRAAPYLYYILQQAHKRHLPAEIVLLPIIESAFNPFAYSPMGAEGIWQMMPGTATGYGIKQDWWYDGRRDVITSTKAALNYISYLGSFFDNNWLLAIAAYDTGEGNVMGAIRKNIRDGYNTDFWSLPLAQETRDYVPRLLALATIIAHPEKYPVYFPPVHDAPYLAQMDIGIQIDLKHAAGLAGLSLKTLMQLNPGFNRATTAPHGPHKLVLPIENVAQFSANLAMMPNADRLSPHHYRLKDLEATLRASAKPSRSVTSGRAFVSRQRPVTSGSFDGTSTTLAANGNYEIQPGDTIYMSRNGDSVERIARHFHVSKSALLASNPLNSSGLRPGQRLVIPTHLNTQVALAGNTKSYDMPSFTW